MYLNSPDSPGESLPMLDIKDILSDILAMSASERIQDIKRQKFCLLETFRVVEENEQYILLSGIFISGRRQFRPNLIDGTTAVERENPKRWNEGEKEKTHFAIKVDLRQDEVFFIMEHNFQGVNIQNAVNYFNHHYRLKNRSLEIPTRFSIHFLTIAQNNFLTELERLSRSVLAEIYIDKQILGGQVLNLSNRTVPVKQFLKLTATAKPQENIQNFAIDAWNSMSGSNSNGISKIRIHGKDRGNNDVMIDTQFIGRKEFADVDTNATTGELSTSQLITELIRIAKSF